jgi:predicted ATPase
MFAVPHPLFIRDQGVFFERHWTTLEACFAAAALAALREGLDTADATGEHFWDAELHRLTGTVLLAENKLDEGQASLQQAISTAQTQQAKSLELRAATSLTRFWGEQGRRAEARDLLAPVYGWFTEGFDTADLKEAKALLDHLA